MEESSTKSLVNNLREFAMNAALEEDYKLARKEGKILEQLLKQKLGITDVAVLGNSVTLDNIRFTFYSYRLLFGWNKYFLQASDISHSWPSKITTIENMVDLGRLLMIDENIRKKTIEKYG